MNQQLDVHLKLSLWIDASKSLNKYKPFVLETIFQAFEIQPLVGEVISVEVLTAKEEAVIYGHSEAFKIIINVIQSHLEDNKEYYKEFPQNLRALSDAMETLDIGNISLEDHLEVFFITDQPQTCPQCGSRAEVVPHTASLLHNKCLNQGCLFEYLTEEWG